MNNFKIPYYPKGKSTMGNSNIMVLRTRHLPFDPRIHRLVKNLILIILECLEAFILIDFEEFKNHVTINLRPTL